MSVWRSSPTTRATVWQASKNTVDMYPIEVQEADAVELKDGRVMMFARTYSGHPARAYSSDKGETWSKGELIKELVMATRDLPTVRRIPVDGRPAVRVGQRGVDRQGDRHTAALRPDVAPSPRTKARPLSTSATSPAIPRTTSAISASSSWARTWPSSAITAATVCAWPASASIGSTRNSGATRGVRPVTPAVSIW